MHHLARLAYVWHGSKAFSKDLTKALDHFGPILWNAFFLTRVNLPLPTPGYSEIVMEDREMHCPLKMLI